MLVRRVTALTPFPFFFPGDGGGPPPWEMGGGGGAARWILSMVILPLPRPPIRWPTKNWAELSNNKLASAARFNQTALGTRR